MNEISRCCRLLGVKSGASAEDVRKTYRDLVQVWHPDRFSTNERLKAKAQEQLKEINLAYEYLVANAFQDGVLVEPPEEASPAIWSQTGEPDGGETPPDTGTEARTSTQLRMVGWLVGICFVIGLAAVGAVMLTRNKHDKPQSTTASSAEASNEVNPTVLPSPSIGATNQPSLYVSQFGTNPPYSQDILDSMLNVDTDKVIKGTDGLVLQVFSPNLLEHICANQLVTPPFVIRATIKLQDINDFRLYCGMGRIIFNSEGHLSELDVNNPADGELTNFPGRGLVLAGVWHEVAWEVTKTAMTVAVDGEVRYHDENNYAGMKVFPGIGAGQHLLTVKSFIVEALQPPSQPQAQGHKPPPGDVLPALIPEKKLKMTMEPDGVALAVVPPGVTEDRLKTAQQVHAPFTIRTRAKTDSTNLRLFGGTWEVIFNAQNRCRDLVLRNTASRKDFTAHGKGLISPNEWHSLVWRIQERSMTVEVDGEVRYKKEGDFHNFQVRPGIGPASGSRVTVDYFIVEKN